MEKNVKEFEIFGRDITLDDGRKFKSWRVKKKDGKFMTCKFTMEVKNVPDFSHGFVTADSDHFNVSNSGIYPCLWITKILSSRAVDKNEGIDDLF